MTYKGFKDFTEKRRYICKSEINRYSMREMGLPDAMSVEYCKNEFDKFRDDRYVKIVITGNSLCSWKQRHTKYINKFAFYKFLMD